MNLDSKILAESGSWRVEQHYRDGYTEFQLVSRLDAPGFPAALRSDSDSESVFYVKRLMPYQTDYMDYQMRVRGFAQIDRDSVIESMNDSFPNRVLQTEGPEPCPEEIEYLDKRFETPFL